jgi:hypothetical protein
MNTITGLDVRAGLTTWLQTVNAFYCKDIMALPADKLDASPGGVARTPRQVTAEVIWLTKWGTAMLTGQEAPAMGEEAQTAIAAHLTTTQSFCDNITSATNEFVAAINSASDETLMKMVTPPWQMDAPAHAVASIIVNHIWYHDGQLNYIQSLYGDEKNHWRD